MKNKIQFKLVLIVLSTVFLASCAGKQPVYSQAAQQQKTATGVEIKASPAGRALTPSIEYVRTKMERSIFLDPPEDNKKVYLRIRDTSDRDWNLDIEGYVAQQLNRNGFEVVKNARDTAYALSVNILLASEVSAAELAQLDETKYGQGVSDVAGSVLIGAVVGGGGAALLGGHQDTVAVGAALGAVAGGLLSYQKNKERDALLQAQQETKFFSVVIDIEVRERIKGGAVVSRQGTSNKQASARKQSAGDESVDSSETQSYADTTTWKTHRTRLNGKAKGKLVAFADVEQEFASSIAKSIGGIF